MFAGFVFVIDGFRDAPLRSTIATAVPDLLMCKNKAPAVDSSQVLRPAKICLMEIVKGGTAITLLEKKEPQDNSVMARKEGAITANGVGAS